jgi:exonuclease V gamma subunit
MAGVPARLILVTGLDNDSFPISEDQPAWHPLCREKREGDPSAREADRHALLLAILSARERLVFSFCGGSDEDQKERPPSTALADVLNAIDSIAKTREPGPAHAAIVHRHPLNGCSPRAFRRNTSPNAVGKNPADYTAAKHIASRAKRPVFQGPWSLVLPAETDVRPTLADLHLLLKDPVRIFLQRLGVHAPREQEEPDGSDLVELDELQKWSIRDELLLARLEGGDQEGVLRRLSVSGRVPRGALGEAILADLGDGTNSGLTFTPSERMAQSCRVFVSSAEGTFTPFWLEGSPRAGWYRKPGDPSCYYFSVSKLKDSEMKRLPPFLLDALAIAASEPGEEAASGPSGASVCASRATGHFLDNQIVLPGLTPERARALLTPLVELYQLARQIPLPFWPDASAAGLAHFEKAGGDPAHIPDALEAARQRWAHGKFTMPGSAESKHAATRLAFRGLEDPMTWHPGLEARFLGEAGEMLAWRVARYLQRWMTGVIPATPSKAAKQKKS